MARPRKKINAGSGTVRPKRKRAPQTFAPISVPFHTRLTLQVLLIIGAILWIYWPAIQGAPLWDDDVLILQNPLMHDPAGWWKIWLEPGRQREYYPLTANVEWAFRHFWGKETLPYHLISIILHIVSSLLVWRLLAKFGLRLAWVGGLFFAVHPTAVESVAWMAELKNTLSLALVLGAMIAWIDYDGQGERRNYFLALALFFLAILAKITVIFFPVVILLYAWWRRERIGVTDLKQSAPFFAVSLVLGLIPILAGIWSRLFLHPLPGVLPEGGLPARVVLAGTEVAFYFWKCIWPARLLPVYPKWQVDPSSPVQWVPWLVLGLGIYWLWTQRRGWGRHALLAVGFFLINLAPCPGFIPAPNMGFAWTMDHFVYLPIIGLIGLAAAGLGLLNERIPGAVRPAMVVVLGGIAAAMALASHAYAARFIDEETLCRYTIDRNPDAWIARNNLGCVLLQRGAIAEAMDQLNETLKIKPDYEVALYNLGNLLLVEGRVPEAIDALEHSLRVKPDYANAHNNLGNAFLRSGHAPEALEQFELAVQFDPDSSAAHNNLANVLRQAGRMPEALDQYSLALQSDEDSAEAHSNLGNAFIEMNRSAEAIEQLKIALRLDPRLVQGHYNMALALAHSGRLPEACEELTTTLAIKPDFAAAQNLLDRIRKDQVRAKTGQ